MSSTSRPLNSLLPLYRLRCSGLACHRLLPLRHCLFPSSATGHSFFQQRSRPVTPASSSFFSRTAFALKDPSTGNPHSPSNQQGGTPPHNQTTPTSQTPFQQEPTSATSSDAQHATTPKDQEQPEPFKTNSQHSSKAGSRSQNPYDVNAKASRNTEGSESIFKYKAPFRRDRPKKKPDEQQEGKSKDPYKVSGEFSDPAWEFTKEDIPKDDAFQSRVELARRRVEEIEEITSYDLELPVGHQELKQSEKIYPTAILLLVTMFVVLRIMKVEKDQKVYEEVTDREKAILEQQISTLKYMKENIKDEISKHVVPDVEAELKREHPHECENLTKSLKAIVDATNIATVQ